MTYRHRLRIGIGSALAMTVLLVGQGAASASASAVPAGPELVGLELVGLGDSYAAGLGSGDYDQDSGDCYRSPHAYAVQVSRRIGAQLDFVACSGATTADVAADQLGALSAQTTDVTLTVGGNDVGFADVMTDCALPSWAGDCAAAVRVARQLVKQVLPGRLGSLYDAIAAAAPNAKVVVVGYPRLFNGQDCSPLTWFTPREMTKLNGAANLLDSTTKAQVRSHHFTFVDPRADFTGHAICDADPWLNNLTYPVNESFHPNVSGQTAYADLVLAAVGATRR